MSKYLIHTFQFTSPHHPHILDHTALRERLPLTTHFPVNHKADSLRSNETLNHCRQHSQGGGKRRTRQTFNRLSDG